MHALTRLGFAALLAAGSLATRYDEGLTLRVESELRFEVETTAFTMERNGEPLPAPEGGGAQFSSTEVRRAVHADTVLASAEGRPRRVRRAFETLDATTTVTLGAREPREVERQGPLAGLTLELELDDDDAVSAKVVDGDESDEALLEGHRLELALDALLPAGDVEPGASWSLDGAAVHRALGTDISDVLFPPPDGDDEGPGPGAGGRRRLLARLLTSAEWSGTATLAAEETTHDGLTAAEIRIEVQASGDLPAELLAAGRGGRGGSLPEMEQTGTFELELAGRLLVSRAEHRPLLLEVEGPLEMQFESRGETTRGEGLSMSVTRKGTLACQTRVTRVESTE